MFRRHSHLLVSATKFPTKLKINECPRDAIQGLPDFIPTEQKVSYLTKLLPVGYDTLDCVSFVPAKILPQLADSEEVLNQLAPTYQLFQQQSKKCTKLLAVVANVRGAVKACQFDSIAAVGYPLSASETFQRRNTNRSIAEALKDIEEMQKICNNEGAHQQNGNETKSTNKKQLAVCISMAFGNPYNETVTGKDVRRLCQQLYDIDVPVIYFADTVGSGSAEHIQKVFLEATDGLMVGDENDSTNKKKKQVEFGIHLHSLPGQEAEDKLEALMSVGCRRFDGALCSLGGCPFAKSELVGNIDSEAIVKVATRLGLDHGVDVFKQLEAKEELLNMLPFLRKKIHAV